MYERDVEVDIYVVDNDHPVVQRHPAFDPLVMRCPHGTRWCAQPTTDQRTRWATAVQRPGEEQA